MGLFSLFGKSKTLYFPGCITYFNFKDNFELYREIFLSLDIDFKIIDKKICCGLPPLEAGYETEARKLIRRNFEIFKEEGITSIITNSPCCYKMFLQDYPQMLPDWNIIVKNIWSIVLTKLEKNPGLIKNKVIKTATYNDSCYLGRYCEIYEEPRKILNLIGYKIEELNDSKEESFCCGSCGGLMRINLELADKIAKEKILQAKRIKAKKIITSSLNDYELLKKNSSGTGVEVLEFSEVLAYALGIYKKTKENKDISETRANIKIQEEINEDDYSGEDEEDE